MRHHINLPKLDPLKNKQDIAVRVTAYIIVLVTELQVCMLKVTAAVGVFSVVIVSNWSFQWTKLTTLSVPPLPGSLLYY